MEKIYIDLIEAAINSDKKKVISLTKELAIILKKNGNTKDSKYISSIIGNTSTVSITQNKNLLIVQKENLDSQITFHNSEILNKILKFLINNNRDRKINTVKMIITGRPGTGKTSLVRDISKKINFNLYSINASKLVSHRLGETQKNIDKLLIDINNNYLNSIFMIDEFDSLIGSRTKNINDEYHRMIGTFNIFLDSLPNESIIIAISNQVSSIDYATIRRFNVNITMDDIDLEALSNELFLLANKNKINYNEIICNKIFESKKDCLDYSYIDKIIANSILNSFSIEKSIVDIMKLDSLTSLNDIGLTLREIEEITSISKSSIQRSLKNVDN